MFEENEKLTDRRFSNNFVLMTGLLVSKERNADNVDSKRPVLDFEVLFQSENGPCIEAIPALLSGGPLARSLPGLNVGAIYEIGGYVRNDEEQGLYVEVTKLVKLCENKKTSNPVSLMRVRLMEMEMVPNVAMVIGKVKSCQYGLLQVRVERETLTKGDLTDADEITVDALDTKPPQIGDTVTCIGQLCRSSLFADKIIALKEES